MKKIWTIWTIADSITLIRIIGTLCLLFMRPFSPAFYILYTVSGITDALDGFIARKTGSSGEFGAKLDSAADLLFYGVMIFKLFSHLLKILTLVIWLAVAVIVALRISAYLIAAVKYHKFSAMHTYMNKLTGVSIFLLPYILPHSFAVRYCCIACFVAFASSLEELLIHVLRSDYDSSVKSIFIKREKLR